MRRPGAPRPAGWSGPRRRRPPRSRRPPLSRQRKTRRGGAGGNGPLFCSHGAGPSSSYSASTRADG
eukprot:6235313-Alexandrium_andersonii.AAC.1